MTQNLHGLPCFFEIQTQAPETVKDFYAAVLGWETHAVSAPDGDDGGKAFIFRIPGTEHNIGTIGSYMTQSDTRPFILQFFHVKSVQDAVEQAQAHGGELMIGPLELPNFGHMAIIQTPDKIHIGLSEIRSDLLKQHSDS